jgi:hypothetical protein
MSHFEPTEYLTIDQAIDRVVELLQGDAGSILTEEEKGKLRAEAGEVLRQHLYSGGVPSKTITESGGRISTPEYIWGGDQWDEVLQSGRIKFSHGHVLSNPVSGCPLILRDALEAAFEPDRAVKEEPQPEPGPSKESQAKELPVERPLQRALELSGKESNHSQVEGSTTATRHDQQENKSQPKADAEQDAHPKSASFKNRALKDEIEKVLRIARQQWPEAKKRPEVRRMAKDLLAEHGDEISFQFEAVRKILDGSYPPSQRFDIAGL